MLLSTTQTGWRVRRPQPSSRGQCSGWGLSSLGEFQYFVEMMMMVVVVVVMVMRRRRRLTYPVYSWLQ
jgi:hypothetical protein